MKKAFDSIAVRCLLFWARLVIRARRPLIVGITGSVGKTTTKEVIAAALRHPAVRPAVGTVWSTPGNMNNTQGVPLVILGYRHWPRSRRQLARWLLMLPLRALKLATGAPYPRVLVLEFAAGPKGDMGRTTRVAPPTVAVVTAIGPAHLEAFGTIDRIVEEKSALVRRADPAGLVVLGAENAHALSLARLSAANVATVAGRGRELSENAARAVCGYLGVPPYAVERALADRPVVKGRLHVAELDRLTVIDDAYNANPLSMQLGLDTLADRPGRRVAILGDMKELGRESPRYHDEIAAYARSKADVVVGVGPMAVRYLPDHWFETSADCASALARIVRAGDCVLVKGSNSVGLDHVVRTLRSTAREVPA